MRPKRLIAFTIFAALVIAPCVNGQTINLAGFHSVRVTIQGAESEQDNHLGTPMTSVLAITDDFGFDSLKWDSTYFYRSTSSSSLLKPLKGAPPYTEFDTVFNGIGGSIDTGKLIVNCHIHLYSRSSSTDEYGFENSGDTHSQDFDLTDLRLIPSDSSLLLLGSDSTVSLHYSASEWNVFNHEVLDNLVARDTAISTFPVRIRLAFSASQDAPNLLVHSPDHNIFTICVYPNPFSQSTTISFMPEVSGYADVSIVNLLGVEVAHIFSGELAAGEHTFTWDASAGASGDACATSGVYECLVRMNGRIEKLPLMIVR